MALSYRLYQIRRTSGGTNTDNTGILTNSELSGAVVDGDARNFVVLSSLSGVTPREYRYYKIGQEIMYAQALNDISNGSNSLSGPGLQIEKRGALGTVTEFHGTGESLFEYTQQPSLDPEIVVGDEVSDFDVVEMSEIEKAIEQKKGQFRINNVNVTVQGVNRHRLQDAGSIQKPWVFEVRDSNGNLRFQGYIREDIEYNAESRLTSFQAVSWLDVLNKSGSITAKTIYEDAKIRNVQSVDTDNETSEIEIRMYDIRNSVNISDSFPNKSDTAAIETNKGEFRGHVKSVDDSKLNVIDVTIQVDDTLSQDTFSSQGNNDPTLKVAHAKRGGDYNNVFYYVDSDLRNFLSNVDRQNEEAYRVVLIDSGGDVVESYSLDVSAARTYPEYYNGITPAEAGTNDIVAVITRTSNKKSVPSHSHFKIVKDSGAAAVVNKLNSVTQDDKATFLSQEAWGYGGITGSNGYHQSYDPRKLIEALLTVNDRSSGKPVLGVIPRIIDDTNPVRFSAGSADDQYATIDAHVRFPKKPIKALRMIQQTTGLLLKETVSTVENSYGDQVPNVEYELYPRDKTFQNNAALIDVLSWKENVVENEIDELKNKSVGELEKLEEEQREELRSLRFDLSSGKAKNVDNVRKLKKDIAQIKTVINQKT